MNLFIKINLKVLGKGEHVVRKMLLDKSKLESGDFEYTKNTFPFFVL